MRKKRKGVRILDEEVDSQYCFVMSVEVDLALILCSDEGCCNIGKRGTYESSVVGRPPLTETYR